MLNVGEQALLAVSALVVVVGLAGLVAVVLAGLNERERELAILRSVGAGPRQILTLLTLEGLGLILAGILLGLTLLTLLSLGLSPWLTRNYGLTTHPFTLTAQELELLAWIIGIGALASLLPGWKAYRMTLSIGLTPRI